jgi:sugar O-acyltransferase (sialic acid O-acetyltransferase NeuD family)
LSKVIVFGIGGLSEVLSGYISTDHEISAYTVDARYMNGNEFLSRPIVPFETIEEIYNPGEYLFVAFVTRQHRTNRRLLERVMKDAKGKGYRFLSYIDQSAYVADVEMGRNCIVSPYAIIELSVSLGDGVIARSGAYIGHHVTIGDYSYIAPRASISGYVSIGRNVFVGNNATLRDQIVVGDDAVIGAGAVVLRDVKPGAVYKAMEARLLDKTSAEVEI